MSYSRKQTEAAPISQEQLRDEERAALDTFYENTDEGEEILHHLAALPLMQGRIRDILKAMY